jgi:transcriptional regulator with XRE-family HTH domain
MQAVGSGGGEGFQVAATQKSGNAAMEVSGQDVQGAQRVPSFGHNDGANDAPEFHPNLLRALRVRLGLSQDEFARLTRLTRSNYGKMERDPNSETRCLVRHVLEVGLILERVRGYLWDQTLSGQALERSRVVEERRLASHVLKSVPPPPPRPLRANGEVPLATAAPIVAAGGDQSDRQPPTTNALRSIRHELGLTQRQFAAAIGVPRTTYGDAERDPTRTTEGIRQRIAAGVIRVLARG